MSCLVWNACGLGNHRAVRDLRQLIAERNPHLLFISETKLVATQCSRLKYQFQYSGCFSVDSDKRRGGLLLLWKDPFEVNIQSYSTGHIDCIIQFDKLLWRFTGF